MKNIHISIDIKAPREKVWETTIGQNTYSQWSSSFAHGSHFEGSWKKGGQIDFLAPNDRGEMEGMISTVVENKPYEFIGIRHLSSLEKGHELNPKTLSTFENYTFKETKTGTEFTIDMDIQDDCYDLTLKLWSKALKSLKELSETPV